jgi:outer membrane protein assembly factor BamB
MVYFKSISLLASVAGLSLTVSAQTSNATGLIYRQDPQSEWEARVPSVRRGNGVFLSPNDDLVLSASSDGYIACFDANTGNKNWDLPPPVPTGMFPSSSSGLAFANDGNLDYVVHAVKVNEITDDPKR